MAPSASMLFLSYHRLHRGPPAEAPRKVAEEEAGGSGGGAVRLSVSSSVFSHDAFARRREAAVRAEGKARCERHAGQEKAAELDAKFEEALRLSCWSS